MTKIAPASEMLSCKQEEQSLYLRTPPKSGRMSHPRGFSAGQINPTMSISQYFVLRRGGDYILDW